MVPRVSFVLTVFSKVQICGFSLFFFNGSCMVPNKPLSTAAGFMLIDFFFFFCLHLKARQFPGQGLSHVHHPDRADS